jgi:hypothetical protein
MRFEKLKNIATESTEGTEKRFKNKFFVFLLSVSSVAKNSVDSCSFVAK